MDGRQGNGDEYQLNSLCAVDCQPRLLICLRSVTSKQNFDLWNDTALNFYRRGSVEASAVLSMSTKHRYSEGQYIIVKVEGFKMEPNLVSSNVDKVTFTCSQPTASGSRAIR